MPKKINWLDRIKRKQTKLAQIELQILELEEKKALVKKELESMQQKYTVEMLENHNLSIEDLAEIISQNKLNNNSKIPEEIQTNNLNNSQ